MSYEESLVRRLAKMLNGEVKTWISPVQYDIMIIAIVANGSSVFDNTSWLLGPFRYCFVDNCFVDIWDFVVNKMMTAKYAWRKMTLPQASSTEELDLMLAAAGV